jgi:hypothetical protein
MMVFLLHHSNPRTGPRNPALENRRALDSEAQFLSTDVKDVQGQKCKGCPGTSYWRYVGGTGLTMNVP